MDVLMKTGNVPVAAMCLFAAVVVVGQAPPQNQQPPEPALKEVIAPDIPGVIKGGTKGVLLRDGFNGTEGVISMPDAYALFPEQDATTLIQADKNDNMSTYLEKTN